jgi:cation:H+ antiporter
MTDLLLLLLGGLGLYYGAEWLVDGAAKLARSLGVPPLAIGLTVVSYGTSAPELAVSIVAGLQGNSAIALGNVVGSNIANIGLILGMTALIAPPAVHGSLRRRDLPLLALATLALPLVLRNGVIDRREAAVFVFGALFYTYATFKWADAPPPDDEESDEGPQRVSWLVLLVVAGLAALIGGGKAFVVGSVGIAHMLGMSDRLVGLTVVAIGTSLPELAASLVAALRGHSELAVGNVVGSNLFNILLVLGGASLVHPIGGSLAEMSYDIWVMLAFTAMCIISMRKERTIGRPEGITLLLGYTGFILGLGMLS